MASAKRSARNGPASSLAPVYPASWMCTLGRSDSNGMFVLQDPTGLGNHSTIPRFVLYLIRNYSQFHSVPAWEMPCPSKARKEGVPQNPEKGRHWPGARYIWGLCPGSYYSSSPGLNRGGPATAEQLRVGRDDDAVLTAWLLTPVCFLFPW